MTSSDFHDYIVYDLLGDIPGVTSKRMFGGYGLYKDGIIFAIIPEDELYFRVSKETLPYYKERGSEPFSYPRAGKTATLKNYWSVPPEILESRDEFAEWMDDAVEASINRE